MYRDFYLPNTATLNPLVVGSIPTRPTNSKASHRQRRGAFSFVGAADGCHGPSIPARRYPEVDDFRLREQALLERPCVTRPVRPDDHPILEQLGSLVKLVGEVPQREAVTLQELPKLRFVHRVRALEPNLEVHIGLG